MTSLQPLVAAAIDEVREWATSHLSITPDGQGGAYVVVAAVDPGPTYRQRETWVGFHVPFNYPYADVYPHFVRGDLSRVDGAGLGAGMSSTSWQGRSAVQISRRSNRLDPARDTALLKLQKVLRWLAER